MTIILEWARSIRTAARTLARRPVYSGLAVILMTIGVGAIAAIFAVVNATLLRPLPYREPNGLYTLAGTEPVSHDSTNDSAMSALELSRWRAANRLFSGIEGYSPATMKLLGTGEPEPLIGAYVSAGLFELLGWPPNMGRSFTRDEETANSGVAIISHGLWERRFGSDPKVVGRV